MRSCEYRDAMLHEELHVVYDACYQLPGRPQPSHTPISNAAIAAKHHATVSGGRESTIAPGSPAPKAVAPAPPRSPPREKTSPTAGPAVPRAKHQYEGYDGPFARLYEPPSKMQLRLPSSARLSGTDGGGSEGRANGGMLTKERAIGGPASIFQPGANAAASAPAGRADEANHTSATPEVDASATLMARLDQQHAMLMQAQAMAAEAEARAGAAMRLNRYILLSLVAVGAVVAWRQR